MPVKAATFPRRSFQSHNPSKEVQQRCKKLAAWQCRRAREIISVQLSEQLGNFFCFFYLSDRRYAFLFFFCFPSNTQCLASHQVIEHPKKKKGCRGKRRHFVMGHPPTHRTRTHSHMHTKKKKVSPTSIKNKSSRSSRNIYTIKNGRGGNTKHDTCF